MYLKNLVSEVLFSSNRHQECPLLGIVHLSCTVQVSTLELEEEQVLSLCAAGDETFRRPRFSM